MNQRIDERALASHWMLLRLAGALPDDTLVRCRAWLAEDNLADLARTVTHAALAARIQLIPDDLNLLAELYEVGGVNPSTLALVDTGEPERVPLFDFAATEAVARDALARLTAGTGWDGDEPDTSVADGPPLEPVPASGAPADQVERALVAWVAGHPAVRAVWRAWRYPSDGAPWPRPRRVFLIETEPDADLPLIAARLQIELADDGEPTPQVEVNPVRAQLPAYQYLARGAGELLWASTPDPGIRLAVVFDAVEPGGGGTMRPDHAVIEPPERDRIAAYLSAGEPLLVSPEAMADVVDPAQGEVVPMNFRTDGFWIWNDASTYYLARHGLSPDPDLVVHVRAHDYAPPQVDGAAVHRANAALARFLSDPQGQR